MALQKPEERLDKLERMALEFNAAMPTDVMLKGDGSIWVKQHGNEGVTPRKLRQDEVLKIIYAAIEYGNKAISV